MVANKNTARDVAQLRYLTKLGALHEQQIHQIRVWPAVVFKKSPQTAQAQIDQEHQIVAYDIVWPPRTAKTKAAVKEREAAAERLAQWTQTLLGVEWSVVVSLTVPGLDPVLVERIVGTEKKDAQDPLELISRVPWKSRFRGPKARG